MIQYFSFTLSLKTIRTRNNDYCSIVPLRVQQVMRVFGPSRLSVRTSGPLRQKQWSTIGYLALSLR